MHSKGTGVVRNCRFAMALYKNVAERGRWAERFMEAFNRYQSGAVDEAALRYLFLGEFGYEAAQTNFAYIMDQEETHLFPEDEAYRRAYINWQRSANQDYTVIFFLYIEKYVPWKHQLLFNRFVFRFLLVELNIYFIEN